MDMEAETVRRLAGMGLNFDQYLNPVEFVLPATIGLTSDIFDEEEEEEEDE